MGAGSPSQQSPCAFFARSVDNRLCSGSWSPTASFLNGARSLSAISANFHPSSSLLTRHVRKRSTVRSPGVELVLFHYLVRLERKLDRAKTTHSTSTASKSGGQLACQDFSAAIVVTPSLVSGSCNSVVSTTPKEVKGTEGGQR